MCDWDKYIGQDYEAVGKCFGFADAIYQRAFGLSLPTDWSEWRRLFDDLGWPTRLQCYDVVLTNDDNDELHIAIAVDNADVIHARADCQSVVREPVKRYGGRIRTAMRLRDAYRNS